MSSLNERLISWAQNEEMVNVGFTEHGIDCIAAAEVMEKQSAEIERLRNLFIEQAARNEGELIKRDDEVERLRSVANRGGHLAAANAEIEQLCALLSAGLSFTTMNAEQARWKRQVAERLGLTDVLELYQ